MYKLLFNVRRIVVIWLTVNKAHDVAASLMCYFDVVRFLRKYPGFFGTTDDRTTDRTRLVGVLPAH